MKPLNRSVAGIRGIWGENLTPDVAVKFAAAFGTYLKKGKVIIGRDTRASGEILTQAALTGLASSGCDVTDIGIVPTPTCQLAVENNVVDGGIVLTASHNPGEWNGLKFINREGHFLSQTEYETLIRIFDNNTIEYVQHPGFCNLQQGPDFNRDAIDMHIHNLMKHINVQNIREKKFKVVLDAVNGAGSRLLIPLLEQLGCTVITLYCDESGDFPRGPEPMPEHLGALCSRVTKEKADIGFAVDPDADRLSLVTETGRALGEEMTLPLVARHVLSRSPEGSIVTNLSTSMAIDHVAREYRVPVIRTKIGEAYVVDGMKKNQCLIGGEGNGGVIFPAVHYARDTGVGVALILDSLAASRQSLSQTAQSIPAFVMIKKKMEVPLEKIAPVQEALKTRYTDAEIDTLDGVKAVWKDRWLHVRKSGTEGLLRIFTEASDQKKADELAIQAIQLIESILKT
ncbi:phosphoglucosamine mutase [bacterium]|nr:phosphoglucosamine mutase [bacterium]